LRSFSPEERDLGLPLPREIIEKNRTSKVTQTVLVGYGNRAGKSGILPNGGHNLQKGSMPNFFIRFEYHILILSEYVA